MAAFRFLANYVVATEEAKDREPLQPMVPAMLAVLGRALQAGEEASAQVCACSLQGRGSARLPGAHAGTCGVLAAWCACAVQPGSRDACESCGAVPAGCH